MKKSTIFCGALTGCALAALALLFACDNDNKKIVAVTPKFLYAASCGSVPTNNRALRHHRAHRAVVSSDGGGTGSVSGFSVDATTGALTALTGQPVADNLQCPEFMAVDPAQKFLFVPDDSSDEIHSYAIGATGTLTEAAGGPVSQCAFQLAVDPSSKFVVAPDYCTGDIDVYSIGSDGTLTAVAGSPFSKTSANQPESALIDPTGKWVYVVDANDGPGDISAFSLSAAGALAEISGSPFAAGDDPYSIAGTPDGKFIYVNDLSGGSSQIDGFSANATTGALTPLSTPTFPGANCWIALDATGTVLFSTDCDANVFSSIVNSDGTLTAAPGSPFDTGTSDPWPVAGDPSGRFVYVGDDSNTTAIVAYSYSSAGVLSAVSGSPFAPAGTYTEGIVITH